MKKIIKKIFSLTNVKTEEGARKKLCILGLEFLFKKPITPWEKVKYVNHLLLSQFDNSNFVEITNEPYKNTSDSAKLIAFYLPQFHSFPENDKWHGRGFNEWTNVTKSIPLYKGHHQPQLPIDVGFYDLSTDKVMYRQIELAKIYGIYGFCFHYYWFSGKRLMEKPIFNFLNNKELNFPFCLCFANENWSKNWDGGNKEILIEQKFLDSDPLKFAQDILPFFKDERYIKIANKPVLIIYKPQLIKKEVLKNFVKELNNKAKENNFDGVYLIMAKTQIQETQPKEYCMDAVVEFPPFGIAEKVKPKKVKGVISRHFDFKLFNLENYILNKDFITNTDYKLFKTVFPGWDNCARKACNEANIFETEPQLYKKWLKSCIEWTKNNNNSNEQFVFINAWNEWAEGAHLEPDRKYGYAYLQATKEALEESQLKM